MNKVNQHLAELVVAVTAFTAAGAVNATPPKDNGGCKTNCGGGTTTPVAGNQTTDVTVGNTIKIDNNPSATSSSTSSSGVVLQPGAIAPVANAAGGSVGNVTNGGNTLDNKNTLVGGSQTMIVERPKTGAQSPTAPTMIGGAGVGIVDSNKLIDRSAVEACARMPMSGSTWSGAVTTPFLAGSLGKSSGVKGIDKVWEDKVIVGEDGVERTVRVDSECLAAFKEEQRKAEVRGSGPAGAAVSSAVAVSQSPDLQYGVTLVKPYAACAGDLVTNSLLGVCPTAPTEVTETVKNFSNAAQGVPQQEICPTGTKRAGLPPVYNVQIGKHTCG